MASAWKYAILRQNLQRLFLIFHGKDRSKRTHASAFHGNASGSGADVPDDRIGKQLELLQDNGTDFPLGHRGFVAEKCTIRQQCRCDNGLPIERLRRVVNGAVVVERAVSQPAG
ncbi:hypothetical protein [Ruminococcus sp.]|uniref:hypothetical protein n=1 Tax=Ruminococcus sp. TaxID=41978 RepID=UPI00300F3E30